MNDKYFESEIESKDLNEKLGLLESIENKDCFTEEDIKKLELLLQDKESEVRSRIAEALVNSKSSKAEKMLVSLLNDKIALVRANACDSLYNSHSIEVFNMLKGMIIKDKSSLVRGYAALSAADIADNIKYNIEELRIFFAHALENEKSTWVKIIFYKLLYLLGDKIYLDMLMNELGNKSYRNRIAVVNILSEIYLEENIIEIKSALTDRLRNEKVISVKNSIEDFLNSLD